MSQFRPTLLVIDDEPTVRDTVSAIASEAGFSVLTAACGSEGIRVSREQPLHVAMIDIRMADVNGLQVLQAIHEKDPRCRAIMITGDVSVDTAVEAMKRGAFDYLSKPLDPNRITRLLGQVRHDAEQDRHAEAQRRVRQRDTFGMVGNGAAMQRLFSSIKRLAPFVRTGLITGETGTGKELVARALHKAGRRGDKRFVAVNCSAVVESLFESELFGHVRGAFTGAVENKPGLFEAADRGVLFLDEVGELSPGVQSKLLRVLEMGEVHRVGSLEARRVDVQVLAATNRDLRAEVAAGRFRSDLYYRLNIVEFAVPPLRDRREDIPSLAEAFARECANRWSRPLTGISEGAERVLLQGRWEGNVRELRNVIERACLLTDSTILSDQDVQACMPPEPAVHHHANNDARLARAGGAAPLPVPGSAPSTSEPTALTDVEREHIRSVLNHARGNKKAAARVLGITRRSLYRRLERLGLDEAINRRGPANSRNIEQSNDAA